MRAPTWTSIGCGPSTRIVRCRFRVRAEDGFVARLIIGPHCPVVSGEFIRNRRLQQCSPYVSCRKIRTLALKRGELLRGAWTVSGEAGCAALGELAPADRIDHGPAQRSGGVDAIDLGAAEAEDLGLEVRRQRGIAVALAQLAVHGEAAERLELVLGRAVPDRIGAPEHTVFTDMAQQLAQRMRRRGRVAHEEAPRAAELGIDIAVGRDAVVDQRLDQAVDAALGMRRVERPLAPAGLEAGMVDDEADVGIKPRDAADIDTARVMLGHAGEGQALVDADGADAEGPRLLDEGDADPRVVEIPALAARAPLRIDLPRGDRPLARRPRHDA